MTGGRRRLPRLGCAIVLAAAIAGHALSAPARGADMCLRGINLAGAEFGTLPGRYDTDYIYPSERTIRYFAERGFNAVRLPFRWERLQPRLMSGFDKAERTRLADTVTRLKAAGMTVVLDPHNYARYRDEQIGSASVPDAAFADFWRRLAEDYGGDPKVQFGLMNEPYDVPADQWLASANAAIAAIRAAGAD
ncbi:glycoside hydrolase family 5 protein, partial [Rhizobium sp. TRM95111]|uniref:glycoside hydrolase family 5 protein n=1 Tax=Rhizobium alarense TaxID=2846851 RepID=UPI001F420E15